MAEVIVSAVLASLLGSLLVPWLWQTINRRSERYRSSVALVDSLARSLWTYWTLALRVAFYGKQGQARAAELGRALGHWDSDEAWQLGCKIRIQISEAKRLLPKGAHRRVDIIQETVIECFDNWIDPLRDKGQRSDWEAVFRSLKDDKRPYINEVIGGIVDSLKVGDAGWWRRTVEAISRRFNRPLSPGLL